jgi:hypothetical protein
MATSAGNSDAGAMSDGRGAVAQEHKSSETISAGIEIVLIDQESSDDFIEARL